MNSPRRQARQAALKALYQIDLIKAEPEEAINQVLGETLYGPAFQKIAEKFLKSSKASEVLSGEVENFVPDFSGKFSSFPLPERAELKEIVKFILEKHFPGVTYNEKAEKEVVKLSDSVINHLDKLSPIEKFSRELVVQTSENIKSIDKTLESVAKNWTLDRMASIDRCILRFATCELLHFPAIPTSASINEAIELAKEFSADRSFEFVNGILDKIRKEKNPEKNKNNSERKPDNRPKQKANSN